VICEYLSLCSGIEAATVAWHAKKRRNPDQSEMMQ